MEKAKIIMGGFVRLSTAITVLHKNLERVKTARVQSLNLKNGEVLMMYMLYDNPAGLSAEQLSRACHLDRSFISRSVQSLHAKHLILCQSIPEGKRRYGAKLYLSEKGEQVGYTLHKYVHEVQAFLNEGISRSDLEIMYTTLKKLTDRFEELNRITRDQPDALS